MVKIFYLAHNWESRHDVRIIQKYLERHFNIKFINPFYDTTQADDMIDWDFRDIMERYYGSGKTVKAHKIDNALTLRKKKHYRNEDLKMIRETDGLVCILLETGRVIGSVKEIFYAHEIAKKPVYLICADKRFTQHMWHTVEVTKSFETIDKFITYLILKKMMRE